MDARVTLTTLGVTDVARARSFYEALGWRGAQQAAETVFFPANGQAIVLWSRERLAADAGVTDDDGAFGGIVLAHNVRSREEVDAVLERAARAGGTITKPAAETFYGGYAGYFRDPDGHLWEIAHNPGFPLDERGDLTLPSFDDA